jgi:diguanylate cyclase
MLNWFTRPTDAAEEIAAPDLGEGTGKVARRALLDQIAEFLLANDLDTSPANFALAHAAFAGTDLDLAGKITARQIAGEPIDQGWLDSLVPPPAEAADNAAHDANAAGHQQAELDRMMSRLETSVATFSVTASNAHGATASYGSSLEEHVAQIDRESATGAALTSLAEIARAMLARTRSLEADMKRSTEEAAALREGLDRARRDATIDHLTGLPNRRAFEAVLEQQYREAQREIDNLCVAFCDIDRFKLVNDTHGHDTGDRVIQSVAEVLARISNENCHVARHGGEEFVLLFRGLTVAQSAAILDQAREGLAQRNFINRSTDQPIGQVTFSGGIADVFAFPDTREALRAADKALYRAKNEGRNRICSA